MLWEAWKLAKAYRTRPSSLYGITDEVAAWCFDRAVFLFGTELEAELRDATDGAKNKQQSAARQQRVMAKWLGGKVQYKDPAAGTTSGTVGSQGTGPVAL